jgi:endonuclease/exonuclease/phosphatase family metal-dependent hydrolase
MSLHVTKATMAARRRWAAVASRRPMNALRDPHGASAMVEVDGLRVCSSVFPWRPCGTRPPWTGSSTAEKTEAAVASVLAQMPVVWGGDWNHAMSGREWTGSIQGRRALVRAVEHLGLQLPTSDCPHQIDEQKSIDHVAVPAEWRVLEVERHRARSDGTRISDHDAYVVEAEII